MPNLAIQSRFRDSRFQALIAQPLPERFRTRASSTTLSVAWKPPPYLLTRDVLNQTGTFENTDAIRLTLDERRISNIFQRWARSLRLEGASGRSWQSPIGMTTCSIGELFYLLNQQAGGLIIGLSASSELAILGIAVDRSLIVKRNHQEVGIVLVIPYRSNSNIYYYRFPPIEDRGQSR